MKKFLRVLLILVAVIIVAGVGFATFITLRGIPSVEPQAMDNIKVELTPERMERGEKLANVLCGNCHANLETGAYTGREMKEAGDQFGFLYSQNITSDKEHGIGSWTDGQIYYLLRTGILKDGRYAPPYMAKLPHMADEDVYSIIAFLRSGRPQVAASKVKDKLCEPNFLTKFLCLVAFEPLPLPKQKITVPDSTNKIAFGKYLAINLDCWTCHSPDFKTMNIMEPEKTPGYFSGGNPLIDLDGNTVLSQNLTPHPEYGIGNWNEEQFVKAVKYGQIMGQPALRNPMDPYTRLTDTEASAIFAYLKTIPVNANPVMRSAFN